MKRFMAILLAGMLSLSAAVPSFAAVATNAGKWAKPSIEFAYQQGLLTEADLQKAKSPMTRKDFCKMVMRFLNVITGKEWKAAGKTPFTDCDDADVTAAYELGIIGGTDPGIFEPNSTLTREQMAIMVARVMKTCGVDLTEKAKKNPFNDTAELFASSNKYIDQLYGIGILAGYQDGGYHPFREMTVQEAVVSFVKAYRYIEEQTGGKVEITEPKVDKVDRVDTQNDTKVDTKTDTKADTKTEEVKVTDAATTETVTVGEKKVCLGWTAAELKAVWGEPDRIDDSVYGLERYVYLNKYQNYFFATMQDGKIVEIFVPGTDFTYNGTSGKGIAANIKNLSHVSSLEHSGIVYNANSEVHVPLDYEGKICGVLLQEKSFAQTKDYQSTLQYTTREAMEAELLDLIQVCRLEKGLSLLTADSKLGDVARAHSEDMTAKGYFDYTGSDGSTPFSRILAKGKAFRTASETIAKQRGDVVQIYQEWMRTAAKENSLTDGTMQEAGVGISAKSKELYVTVDLCGQ